MSNNDGNSPERKSRAAQRRVIAPGAGAGPGVARSDEARIRQLAMAQNGAISHHQLIECGLTPAEVRSRVRRGQLHRIHRGAYTIADPRLLPLAAHSAALLAAGPCSVISHRTAAVLWGITPAAAGGPVQVLVIGDCARRHRGISAHRVGRLDSSDITTKQSLRITTPARTVIDLATHATLSEVEHALSEGRALGLINDAKLNAALDRAPANHPGAAAIRALLKSQVGRAMTRSERERKVLKLLDAAGLPKPLVNQPLHGFKPDFYWPEQRLILEFDGYQTHGGRRKFESDRRRDQLFATRGIQTVRWTWLQLEQEAVALVVRIAQALAARGG